MGQDSAVLVVSARGEVIDAVSALAAGRFRVASCEPGSFPADAPERHPALVLDATSITDAVALGRLWKGARPSGEYVVIVPDDRVGLELLRKGAFDYITWPFPDPGAIAVLVESCLRSAGVSRDDQMPAELAGCRRIRRIGAGGMAEVFLATRESDAATVALKVLRSELVGESEFVDMFVTEAKISSALTHPNIVRVLDSGLGGGRFFLVLEYVDGFDLDTLGAGCSWEIDPRIACHVVARIADALSYAHTRTDGAGKSLGIIHRDVNPPNILLSRGGAVKLTDFGIARSTQRFGKTASGVLKGKIDYMSPEQLQSKATVDHRADLFSLGAVLHLLVGGIHPFRGATTLQTMQLIKRGLRAKPSSLNARIPPTLDDILLRALALDPAERYASGAEMAADLEIHLTRVGMVSDEEVAAFVHSASRRVPPAAVNEPPVPVSSAEDLLLPGVVRRTPVGRPRAGGTNTDLDEDAPRTRLSPATRRPGAPDDLANAPRTKLSPAKRTPGAPDDLLDMSDARGTVLARAQTSPGTPDELSPPERTELSPRIPRTAPPAVEPASASDAPAPERARPDLTLLFVIGGVVLLVPVIALLIWWVIR